MREGLDGEVGIKGEGGIGWGRDRFEGEGGIKGCKRVEWEKVPEK